MNNHLEKIQRGYFEHLYHAWSMAFALLIMSAALLIHGVFPSLLMSYASDRMKEL